MILTQSVTIKRPQLTAANAHGLGSTIATRNVQITGMKTSTMLDMNLDVSRPHLLIDTSDGAQYYDVNGQVTFGSRIFTIVQAPETYAAVPIASNCTVILSEVTRV
jgi:hypothetical protein